MTKTPCLFYQTLRMHDEIDTLEKLRVQLNGIRDGKKNIILSKKSFVMNLQRFLIKILTIDKKSSMKLSYSLAKVL